MRVRGSDPSNSDPGKNSNCSSPLSFGDIVVKTGGVTWTYDVIKPAKFRSDICFRSDFLGKKPKKCGFYNFSLKRL